MRNPLRAKYSQPDTDGDGAQHVEQIMQSRYNSHHVTAQRQRYQIIIQENYSAN